MHTMKVQEAHTAMCRATGNPTSSSFMELLTMGRQVRYNDYTKTPKYKELKDGGGAIIMDVDQNPYHMPVISTFLPCLLRGGSLAIYPVICWTPRTLLGFIDYLCIENTIFIFGFQCMAGQGVLYMDGVVSPNCPDGRMLLAKEKLNAQGCPMWEQYAKAAGIQYPIFKELVADKHLATEAGNGMHTSTAGPLDAPINCVCGCWSSGMIQTAR